MKFLIVSTQPAKGFSGGRYHALMLAKSIAYGGHQVDFVTNQIPQMWGELSDVPDSGQVKFRVSKDLSINGLQRDWNHVICIPDDGWSNVYSSSLSAARLAGSSLSIVNFESPNWFNSLSPFPRRKSMWWPWWILGTVADRIVSSAKESTSFAMRYYWPRKARRFVALGAPINTFALRKALDSYVTKKPHQYFVPTRVNSGDHKGIHDLERILNSLRSGSTVVLMVDNPDHSLVKNLELSLGQLGISVKLLSRISEVEKFKLYAESRLTIFPSLFEGFGYPPIESIACGTPVLVYDLPIYRETLGGNPGKLAMNSILDFQTTLESLGKGIEANGVPVEFSRKAASQFSVEAMSEVIDTLFKANLPRTNPARFARLMTAEYVYLLLRACLIGVPIYFRENLWKPMSLWFRVR